MPTTLLNLLTKDEIMDLRGLRDQRRRSEA